MIGFISRRLHRTPHPPRQTIPPPWPPPPEEIALREARTAERLARRHAQNVLAATKRARSGPLEDAFFPQTARDREGSSP